MTRAAHWTICREVALSAGKMICGVRNETSGQSWPLMVSYNPCRRSNHLLQQATADSGRTRWILILCAWTIVGLLFTVQEIAVAKVHGGHGRWGVGGGGGIRGLEGLGG